MTPTTSSSFSFFHPRHPSYPDLPSLSSSVSSCDCEFRSFKASFIHSCAKLSDQWNSSSAAIPVCGGTLLIPWGQSSPGAFHIIILRGCSLPMGYLLRTVPLAHMSSWQHCSHCVLLTLCEVSVPDFLLHFSPTTGSCRECWWTYCGSEISISLSCVCARILVPSSSAESAAFSPFVLYDYSFYIMIDPSSGMFAPLIFKLLLLFGFTKSSCSIVS